MRATSPAGFGALSLLTGLVLLTGCPRSVDPGATPSGVVTTVVPLRLIVEAIAGDRLEATSLVPAGGSPHTFEPRPSDVARLANARIFIRIGKGVDDWVARLLSAAPSGLEVHAVLEPRDGDGTVGQEHGHGHAGHAHDGHPTEGLDPHLWLDPLEVRDRIAPALAARLAAIDPEGAEAYRTGLARFQQELTALDDEIRAILAGAPGRHFVAFHAAWRAFARRYGLVEVGVVQAFAGEEPTPRELMRLIEAARLARVPAILVEPQLSPRVAETIAAEFGGTTVMVDPLGNPDDPERDTYVKLLRFDARAFARALGAGP